MRLTLKSISPIKWINLPSCQWTSLSHSLKAWTEQEGWPNSPREGNSSRQTASKMGLCLLVALGLKLKHCSSWSQACQPLQSLSSVSPRSLAFRLSLEILGVVHLPNIMRWPCNKSYTYICIYIYLLWGPFLWRTLTNTPCIPTTKYWAISYLSNHVHEVCLSLMLFLTLALHDKILHIRQASTQRCPSSQCASSRWDFFPNLHTHSTWELFSFTSCLCNAGQLEEHCCFRTMSYRSKVNRGLEHIITT